MTFRSEIAAIFERQDEERRERHEAASVPSSTPERRGETGLAMLRQIVGRESRAVAQSETADGLVYPTLLIGTETSDSDLERLAERLPVPVTLKKEPEKILELKRRNLKGLEEFRELKDAYVTPFALSESVEISSDQIAALARSLIPYPGFSPRLFGNWALWRIHRVANDRVVAEILRGSMPSPSTEKERLEPFLTALSAVKKGLETNVLFPMNDDRGVLIDPTPATARRTIRPLATPFTVKNDSWSDVVEVGQYVMAYLSVRARQVRRELKANLLVAGRPVTPFYRDLQKEIILRLQSAAKKMPKKIAATTALEVLEILQARQLIAASLAEFRKASAGKKGAKRVPKTDPKIKTAKPKSP